MITVLSGSNSFAVRTKLRALISNFCQQNPEGEVEHVDVADMSVAELKSCLQAVSLFSQKRLLIVEGLLRNKMLIEHMEDVLSIENDDVSVIIHEPKFDKRSSLYKVLKKKTEFYEFAEPNDNELVAWMVDFAKEQGATIARSDAQYLVSRVGINQQRLSNELQKLANFDSIITRHSIDELSEQTPSSTIFQLVEEIFSGKTKPALATYDEQRQQKVEPQAIIGMLAWQLHILALLSVAQNQSIDDIARTAKVNPYVLRKSQGLSHRLSRQRLFHTLHTLSQIDIRIKTTSVNPDMALREFIIEFSSAI